MSHKECDESIVRVVTIIDGSSEEVVDLIEIARFDLAAFTVQFDVPVQHDPDMHDRYAVGPDDVPFLLRSLDVDVTFDFTHFAYFIDACRRE